MCVVNDTTLPDVPFLLETSDTMQAATPSSMDQNDALQPIDQVFATFRAGLVKQLNAAEENSRRRSAVLESQVKQLESEIKDIKAEHQQLNNELIKAKSEAEKWKAQYEGLRKAMLDTVDRSF